MRGLRRDLCTRAGDLALGHVLPVDSEGVLSEVSKGNAKAPSVLADSQESILIQVERRLESVGWREDTFIETWISLKNLIYILIGRIWNDQ